MCEAAWWSKKLKFLALKIPQTSKNPLFIYVIRFAVFPLYNNTYFC